MIHSKILRRFGLQLGIVSLFALGCNKGANHPPSDPSAESSKPESVVRSNNTNPIPRQEQTTANNAPDPAEAFYSEGLNEAFSPRNVLSSIPMRPRKGDIVYRLSNPRTEPIGKKPYPFLSVNYERLTDGEYGGQSLIIRDSNGNEQTILIFGGMNDRAGVLEIKLGFGPRQQIPKDCEMYFTRQENRYPDGFRPTFKVSNSVTIGTPKLGLTLARPWTDKELAVLKNPPPEGPKVNANPTVGEDTALVGEKNAASFRYAEPGKKVIGVEYWTGQWANEPCLARLTPIYDTKQPTDGVSKRVLSREGYAVGGMTVRSKTFVNAVQLIFMKIKADGSLDPDDNYTSEWLGVEVNGAKETKLGGTGRAVIGIHCKQGAILNSVGLVLDNGRK